MTDLTLAQVDAGIAAAGASTADWKLALLWAMRAHLLDAPFSAAMLPLLIGCTPERAQEIEAILLEQGLVEREGR